ncbi:hypothetical protein SSAG_00424 [Streptomyces sp. Mg1]|nr:hypothetical protein SSAG_00424 [Streptomyces sp. Mg1]
MEAVAISRRRDAGSVRYSWRTAASSGLTALACVARQGDESLKFFEPRRLHLDDAAVRAGDLCADRPVRGDGCCAR